MQEQDKTKAETTDHAPIVQAIWPPGTAYVDRVGWEEDEEHGRRFTVLLVFPTGAPDLTAAVVWEKHPVKIEVQNG